jgi:hypothetical protein
MSTQISLTCVNTLPFLITPIRLRCSMKDQPAIIDYRRRSNYFGAFTIDVLTGIVRIFNSRSPVVYRVASPRGLLFRLNSTQCPEGVLIFMGAPRCVMVRTCHITATHSSTNLASYESPVLQIVDVCWGHSCSTVSEKSSSTCQSVR